MSAEARPGALPGGLAAAAVFGASGAVLVLEILGVRLLAPYVGLTLETYTTIIGVVLAGIALGAALGGRAADEVDPRRLLAALLVTGGLLALATVPLVRVFGEAFERSGQGGALAIALFALLPPAAVLSAVTPVVVKLQLGDLAASGTVVGRLSAWATAGALAGTFCTGFVLVPLLPVRATVIGLGALLVLGGIAVATAFRAFPGGALAAAAGGARAARRRRRGRGHALHDGERLLLRAGADGSRAGRPGACWCSTTCATPTSTSTTRATWSSTTRAGSATRSTRCARPARPLDALFVGGGGFTLPRYVAATRPGSRSRVLEVDPQLVDLARERLGLRTGPALAVRTGDARVTLRDEPDDSADVVVGDAFGGRSIPWHLATAEFVADVRRVLRPDGLYLLNVIDRGDLALVRAEAATLLRQFADVALVAQPGPDGDGPGGGNLVLIASERPLPAAVAPASRGGRTYDRGALSRVVAGAGPLTDDDAPADQLISAGT